MACNWVVMRSSHCPYLVRIESNADFLSRFYGWREYQPHPDSVTTNKFINKFIKFIINLYDESIDDENKPIILRSLGHLALLSLIL